MPKKQEDFFGKVKQLFSDEKDFDSFAPGLELFLDGSKENEISEMMELLNIPAALKEKLPVPLTFSDTKKEEIFRKMKAFFSDFQYFDPLIAPALRTLIDDESSTEISKSLIESIVKHYLKDTADYENLDKKGIFDRMEMILTASTIYLFSFSESAKIYLISTVEELLEKYPHWKQQLSSSNQEDEKELQLLLKFRNYMKLAILFVNPIRNKTFLLRVVERLEDGNSDYIIGGGQRPAVTRRSIDIYHTETGVPLKRKLERRSDSAPRKQTKHNNSPSDRSDGETADFDVDPDTMEVLLNEGKLWSVSQKGHQLPLPSSSFLSNEEAYYRESFTELIETIKPMIPISAMPVLGTSSSFYQGSLTEEIKQYW